MRFRIPQQELSTLLPVEPGLEARRNSRSQLSGRAGVAVFVRMANGNVAPERVITGAATKLSRTVHGIAYDPDHDLIYVPNPLADAVLVFRGGASGDEAPIRVIQGPSTRLVVPHAISLDLTHHEILVASLSNRAIAVFPWDANGNVAPVRYISGPKTRLGHVVGLGVDSATDLLAVANSEEILMFNRTDNGDVEQWERSRDRIRELRTSSGNCRSTRARSFWQFPIICTPTCIPE
ncbi:MAG TPA: hypothetical protein VH640_14925 [Bryobacteraceae bacterium]